MRRILTMMLLGLTIGAGFRSPAEEQSSYRLEGTLERFDTFDDGFEESRKYLFLVEVDGERWLIRTKELNVESGLKGSSYFEEMTFDGRDLFRATYYPPEMRDKDRIGISATAREGTFPLIGDISSKLLWFAFCSSHFIDERRSFEVPWLFGLFPTKTNLSRVTIERFLGGSKLPERFSMKTPENRGLLFASDYVALRYSVVSTKNSGPAELPIKARFEFPLPPSSEEAESFGSYWSCAVTNISTELETERFKPDIGAGAYISDMRFTNTLAPGGSLRYSTNRWISRGIAERAEIAAVVSKAGPYKIIGVGNPAGKVSESPKQEGNFAEFLSSEIVRLEGKKNELSKNSLPAEWVVRRDRLGAAIDITKGDFEGITNTLTGEYGAPLLYIKPREKNQATYLYPATKAGVSIFVKEETGELVEVTLTKPF